MRRRNLLLLAFPVTRVKKCLPNISMIMWTMCLSCSNRSSLQVRPRCHTVSQAAVRSANTAPVFFVAKKLSSMPVSTGDLVYGRPPVSKTRLILWEQWVDGWIDTSANESLENFKRDKHRRFGVPVSFLSLQDVCSNITYVPDLITSLLYDKCLGWTRTPVPRTTIHMHRLFF